MIPFEVYKIFHLVGVFMVVGGLTARPLVGWVGGPAVESGPRHPARRLAAITHGVGLVLVLICGFGMLARRGWSPGQPWVIAKLVIWVLLGGMMAMAGRMPRKAPLVWLMTFVLAGLAAYFAILKP